MMSVRERARWLVLKYGSVLMVVTVVFTTTLSMEWSSQYMKRPTMVEVPHGQWTNYNQTQSLSSYYGLRNEDSKIQWINSSVSVSVSSERSSSQLVKSSIQQKVMETQPEGLEDIKNRNKETEYLSTADHLYQSTAALSTTQPSAHSTESLTTEHIPLLSQKFTPLSRRDIGEVETFVLFAGFARSGHSIVGTLMDAHPDIVIAHEYNVLQRVKTQLTSSNDPLGLFNSLYRNSHTNAVQGWRSERRSQKGYNLSMGQHTWQGRIRRLRVIGDKAAGMAAQQFISDPTTCLHLVDRMQGALGIPVKAIRVLRNPYDIIATRVLYSVSPKHKHKVANISETRKYKNPTLLGSNVHRFFELVRRVNRMITECHLPVLDVHLSDLVRQPRSVMRDVCDYVGVKCSEYYLETCAGKVFSSLSKTRSLVEWPQKVMESVAGHIRNLPEFSRYSYDCDC